MINISLGGDGIGSTMLNAVRRASAAGVVIVMSAGNDGDPNPGGFATGSAAAAGGTNVIIAGAMDDQRNMASFSNRAGNGAAHYLTALGVAGAHHRPYRNRLPLFGHLLLGADHQRRRGPAGRAPSRT